MMHELARIGFTQTYTYFTWRTERGELEDYGRELAASAHYMRPNFFVNTPDILHESLQYGGPADVHDPRGAGRDDVARPGASTPATSCTSTSPVRPGSEEYLDSEKYQLRPRDWAGAEAAGRSLAPLPAPAQRDPPRAPRAAAAAQPALPPGRQPEPDLLLASPTRRPATPSSWW